MNRADVQMLNSSLDSLGESLLKERLLQEKQKDDNERKAVQQQQLGIEQSRVDVDKQRMGAEQTHYDKMQTTADTANTQRAAALQSAQAQQGIKNLQSAYQQISNDFRNGTIDKAEANRRAKALVQNVRSAPDMILKETPFAAMLDSDADLFTGSPGKPALQPAAVATDAAAQGLLDQADELEADDPDGASALRERAQLLRDHLKKNPPKTPTPRKTVTTNSGANKTTLTGTPEQVDQMMAPPAAATQAPTAPLDPKQRKVGMRYTTPKGTYTWGATGWVK